LNEKENSLIENKECNLKKEKFSQLKIIQIENEDTKRQKILLKKKEVEMDKIIMEKQRLLMKSQDDNRNKVINALINQQKKVIEKGGDIIANRVDVEREKINLAGEKYEKIKDKM
jgi:hypothetical protein